MLRYRYVCVLLLLSIVEMVFVGCSSEIDTTPEYKFETDCQYYNCVVDGQYVLAETEESFYYLESPYLRVIDKKTMKSSYLCNKPDCLHAEQNVSSESERFRCNAYVGNYSPLWGISYSEGYLYFVRKDSLGITNDPYAAWLVQLSLDGTSCKYLWKVTWDQGNKGTLLFTTMHRGKFYLLVHQSEGKETFSSVYAYDLVKKKQECVIRYDDYVDNMMLIGNYLYLDRSDSLNTSKIRYDLSSGEVTELTDCQIVFPIDKTLVAYNDHAEKTEDGRQYRRWFTCKGPQGEEEICSILDFSEENGDSKWLQSDGMKIYVMDGYFGKELRVYALESGNILSTIEFPEAVKQWKDIRTFILSQDGRIILFNVTMAREDMTFFYCNISDIGTDAFQWYEVERIN